MKLYLVKSFFGKYDDVTTEINGIFDSLELAKKCKEDIKSEIEITIKETEYIVTDYYEIEDIEYINVLNKRLTALNYSDTIIEEFKLNKRKDYESSK